MKSFNISMIQNLKDYAEFESYFTKQDENIINYFEKQNKIPKEKVNDIINLLKKIKSIMQKNLNDLDNKINNVYYVNAILDKEISKLENDNTLKELFRYDIDPVILNICSNEFNKYYSKIVELRYRKAVNSYRIVFLKDQKKKVNLDIAKIDSYMIMLQRMKVET